MSTVPLSQLSSDDEYPPSSCGIPGAWAEAESLAGPSGAGEAKPHISADLPPGPPVDVADGDCGGRPRHHTLAELDDVVTALAKLTGANLWALTASETLEFLDRTDRASRLLTALQLGVVRELQGRDLRPVFGEEGVPTAEDLLRQQLKMRSVDARRTVALARDLDLVYPRVGAALTSAAITHGQASAIVAALNSLPADTPTERRDWTETFLLAQAEILDAGDLATLGKTIRDRMRDELQAPGRGSGDDGDQGRRRELHLTDQPDGTTRLTGTLDAEAAAAMRAALEPLAKPRPLGESPEDSRTVPQLRADALVEIFERVLATGTLPLSRGTRPHLTVTTTVDELVGRAGAKPAATGYGLPLSRAALDRISCDADLTHILLSREGMPLELGRTRRIVPPWLRRALAARDGGCTFPQCPKPAAWTDAHHIIPWVSGGETSIANTTLLCPFHHRVIHRGEWRAGMGSDGHPLFMPPYSVDPTRQPRRNPLHRDLDHLYTGRWEPPQAAAA
jgi:hypothetical protein